MITIKEMADKIGVSPTTVSNVIHGKTKEVSQHTIDKVMQVVKENNYIPNMSARALAQNSSKIIGVVMKYQQIEERNAVQDPFHSEIIGSIETNIRESGYFMMLYSSDTVEDILKLTATWSVDGLILLGVHAHDYQSIRRQTEKPIVFIDCYFYDDGIPYVNVGLEDRKSTYEMTNYIISQGHSKIAFAADNRIGVDGERWLGYYQAMQEHNIICNDHNFVKLDNDPVKLSECLEQLYNRIHDFTALFFASDYYAIKAINYFIDRGLKVPEDISVVGFDDNILGRNMRPRLTTVRQNPSEKGELAVKQLIKLINNEELDQYNIKLSAKLMIRDTVKNLNQ